jgi:hypothetical protein
MQFRCLLEHGKWIGLLLLLIPMETMGSYLLKSLGLCSSNINGGKGIHVHIYLAHIIDSEEASRFLKCLL